MLREGHLGQPNLLAIIPRFAFFSTLSLGLKFAQVSMRLLLLATPPPPLQYSKLSNMFKTTFQQLTEHNLLMAFVVPPRNRLLCLGICLVCLTNTEQ